MSEQVSPFEPGTDSGPQPTFAEVGRKTAESEGAQASERSKEWIAELVAKLREDRTTDPPVAFKVGEETHFYTARPGGIATEIRKSFLQIGGFIQRIQKTLMQSMAAVVDGAESVSKTEPVTEADLQKLFDTDSDAGFQCMYRIAALLLLPKQLIYETRGIPPEEDWPVKPKDIEWGMSMQDVTQLYQHFLARDILPLGGTVKNIVALMQLNK